MDHDLGSGNDPMGQAIIQLNTLSDKPRKMDVQVLPSRGCFEATGKISIEASYKKNPELLFEEFYGGKLSVQVVEAEGLLAVDSSMFSSVVSSDPYVKLQGTKIIKR